MNIILSVGVAAGLAATLGVAASKQPDSIDPTQTSIVKGNIHLKGVFTLESAGGKASCTIRKGRALSADASQLVTGPHCAALFAPLAEARVWQEGKDGTVDFVGSGGRTLVEFALADGEGYESVRPRSTILSLIAK